MALIESENSDHIINVREIYACLMGEVGILLTSGILGLQAPVLWK